MDRNQEVIIKPNRGQIVIEGMDVIIKRELDRHKLLVSQLNKQIALLKEEITHLGMKQAAWTNMIGTRRFNTEKMNKAISEMGDEVSNKKAGLALKRELLAFSMKQVTMYDEQMNDYYRGLADLAQARKEEIEDGNSHRLR